MGRYIRIALGILVILVTAQSCSVHHRIPRQNRWFSSQTKNSESVKKERIKENLETVHRAQLSNYGVNEDIQDLEVDTSSSNSKSKNNNLPSASPSKQTIHQSSSSLSSQKKNIKYKTGNNFNHGIDSLQPKEKSKSNLSNSKVAKIFTGAVLLNLGSILFPEVAPLLIATLLFCALLILIYLILQFSKGFRHDPMIQNMKAQSRNREASRYKKIGGQMMMIGVFMLVPAGIFEFSLAGSVALILSAALFYVGLIILLVSAIKKS